MTAIARPDDDIVLVTCPKHDEPRWVKAGHHVDEWRCTKCGHAAKRLKEAKLKELTLSSLDNQ